MILCVDFNGRLELENDFVNNDDFDEFLPLPNNNISDNANLLSKRKSCDHESGLKDHGKEIIEFCKMSSFRIANGRLVKDKGQGQFTCFQPNGNSIVDYLLTREGDFDKILDFEIGHINEYSDHGYLDFKIKVEICGKQKKTKNAKSRISAEIWNNIFVPFLHLTQPYFQ